MRFTKQIDHKLITACKRNKPKAQLQLYKKYAQGMLTVAHRYVKDVYLAEDLMQEAFVKAFKNIHTYKEEVSFGAWLKRIVINQCIDELKKNKLSMITLNDEITPLVDVSEYENWEVDDEVTPDMVKNAINQLKEKYRLVLTLYLLEGYDHKEISEILGITEVTSRTHLLRGKKIVKEQLKSIRHAEGY